MHTAKQTKGGRSVRLVQGRSKLSYKAIIAYEYVDVSFHRPTQTVVCTLSPIIWSQPSDIYDIC